MRSSQPSLELPADAAYRVRGPAELLDAVPYLIGFHPHRSLVLVGLRHSALVVTARMDLADVGRLALLPDTVRAMANGGVRELIVAVFADAPTDLSSSATIASAGYGGADRWGDVLEAVHAAAAAHDVQIGDVLLAEGGRWCSLLCVERCCAEGGQPVLAPPSEFSTHAVFAGLVALPSRSALADGLDPAPDAVRGSVRAALATELAHRQARPADVQQRWLRATKRALFVAARASDQPRWSGSSPGTVARFGVALADISVRDSLWVAEDHGRVRAAALWRQLATQLPGPYAASSMFLLGWSAWRSGDGALAGIAVERALDLDPGYSAADLLLAALRQGVNPASLPRLRRPRAG